MKIYTIIEIQGTSKRIVIVTQVMQLESRLLSHHQVIN